MNIDLGKLTEIADRIDECAMFSTAEEIRAIVLKASAADARGHDELKSKIDYALFVMSKAKITGENKRDVSATLHRCKDAIEAFAEPSREAPASAAALPLLRAALETRVNPLHPEQVADLAARCGVKGSAAALAEFAALVREAEPMAPEDMRPAPVATEDAAPGLFTQMAAAVDAAERAHFMRRLNANDGGMQGWGAVGYSSPRASFKFRDSVVPVDVVRLPKATTASASGGGNFVGFAVTGYRTTVNVQGDATTASASGPPAPGRDATLESAVQAVAERAGDADKVSVTSVYEAIRALKTNRQALPESVPAPSRDAAPVGPALREFTRAVVERLGWTINGTFVVTKSGDNLHTADAIAFVSAVLAQQTATQPINPKE